jgi:hypothetical protein
MSGRLLGRADLMGCHTAGITTLVGGSQSCLWELPTASVRLEPQLVHRNRRLITGMSPCPLSTTFET